MNNEAENTMPAAEPVTGEENAAEIPAAETAPPTVKSGENGQPKPSWEELLQDPDYKSRYDQAVQGIVKARLRGRAQAEEKLARLAPVLSALEERYGLTDESDAEALARNLRETGTGDRFTLDPRSMSREDREALKKRILEASAQGRKIGPGE